MNLFYQSIASVLEVAEVNFETKFREVEGWCSLQAFGLLVTMENDWHTPLTIERLQQMNTVGDLFAEAFLEFASKLLKVPRSTLSLDTAYGSISEWDSVNHLRLAMEAEQKFGVYYPIETIPALKKLKDFLQYS